MIYLLRQGFSFKGLRSDLQKWNLHTNTNLNKAQPQWSDSPDLPVGQTIVPADSELRDETLSKINKCLEEGPGRMFAVVHVRGFQHKITDGKRALISL